MVALYVFLAIVAVILTALLLPVKIYFTVNDEITLQLKYMFFSFPILPALKYKPKNKPQNNRDDKTGNIKKLLQEKGISGAVDEILQIINNLLSPFRNLLRRVTFLILNVDIVVADQDAAVTAVEYGAVCALVYPFVAGVESVARIKKRNLQVRCDFDSAQSKISCDFAAQLRPIHLIPFVCSFIFSYLNQKIKDGAQYGRKQH